MRAENVRLTFHRGLEDLSFGTGLLLCLCSADEDDLELGESLTFLVLLELLS